MNRSELDWVCTHLGHTLDVHRAHYRARSDILERIEISKILLMQDMAQTKKFVGRRLEEIQFEGN